MKFLFNLIRTTLYLVIMYYLLAGIFYCFGWGGIKAMTFTINIKERVNPYLFWFGFLLIGIVAISIIWYVFKILSGFIVAMIVKICPYRKFAIWATGIMSAIYALFFLYGFWMVGANGLDFMDIILGLILTAASIQLCVFLVKGVLIGYETFDEIKLKENSN